MSNALKYKNILYKHIIYIMEEVFDNYLTMKICKAIWRLNIADVNQYISGNTYYVSPYTRQKFYKAIWRMNIDDANDEYKRFVNSYLSLTHNRKPTNQDILQSILLGECVNHFFGINPIRGVSI